MPRRSKPKLTRYRRPHPSSSSWSSDSSGDGSAHASTSASSAEESDYEGEVEEFAPTRKNTRSIKKKMAKHRSRKRGNSSDFSSSEDLSDQDSRYSDSSEESRHSDDPVEIIRGAFRQLCTNEQGRLNIINSIAGHFKETASGKEMPGAEFKKILPSILRKMRVSRKLSDQEKSEILEEVDLNRDGSVSFSEFINYITYPKAKLRRIARSISDTINKNMKNHEYHEVYQEIMSKGHETIDKDRLHSYLVKRLGIVLHDGEVQQLLNFLDEDGNGQVDFNEFTKFLQRQGGMFIMQSKYTDDSPVLDIKLSFGENDEESLEKQGYRSSHVNLNEGNYGEKIFMWYLKKSKIETKRSLMASMTLSPQRNKWLNTEPIVEIRISEKSEDAELFADRFTCVDGNTNAGFFNWGTSRYIWYRRGKRHEDADPPIKDVHVSVGNAKKLDSKIYDIPCQGFRRLPANLNEGSKGKDVFLWVRQDVVQEDGDNLHGASREKKHTTSKYDRVSHAIDEHTQEKIRKRYVGRAKLTQLFYKFSGRSDSMTLSSFSKLLRDVGVSIPQKERSVLFDHCNYSRNGHKKGVHGSGAIKLNDFILFCTISEHDLNRISSKLRRAFKSKYKKKEKLEIAIHEAFEDLCSNRSKLVLDPAKFKVLIKDMVGVKLSLPETERFLSRLDDESDANDVSVEEFYDFIEYGNPRLQDDDTSRVLFAAQVLANHLQTICYTYLQKHGTADMVTGARMAWKDLGAPATDHSYHLSVSEISAKLRELASANSHLGQKIILEEEEMEDLLRIINPVSKRKNMVVSFESMCCFACLGKGSSVPITELLLSRTPKTELGYFKDKFWRSGVGITETENFPSSSDKRRGSKDDHSQSEDEFSEDDKAQNTRNEQNVVSLWADRDLKSDYNIRQVYVGPTKPRSQKWEKVSPPIRTLLKGRHADSNVYIWTSSDPKKHTGEYTDHFKVLLDAKLTISPPSGQFYELADGAKKFNVPLYVAFAPANVRLAKAQYKHSHINRAISQGSSGSEAEVESYSKPKKRRKRGSRKHSNKISQFETDESFSTDEDSDASTSEKLVYSEKKDILLELVSHAILKKQRKERSFRLEDAFVTTSSENEKVDYVEFKSAMKILGVNSKSFPPKRIFCKMFSSILDRKSRFRLKDFVDQTSDTLNTVGSSDEDRPRKRNRKPKKGEKKIDSSVEKAFRSIYAAIYVQNSQSSTPRPMDYCINAWIKRVKKRYKKSRTRSQEVLLKVLKIELKAIEADISKGVLNDITKLLLEQSRKKVNWDHFERKIRSVQKERLSTATLGGYSGAIRRIRRVLTGSKQGKDVYNELWHSCERHDKGNSGSIQLRAFRSIASEFGFGLTRPEVRGIQRQFNRKGDGLVDYEALLDECLNLPTWPGLELFLFPNLKKGLSI
eukprot:g5827.t1